MSLVLLTTRILLLYKKLWDTSTNVRKQLYNVIYGLQIIVKDSTSGLTLLPIKPFCTCNILLYIFYYHICFLTIYHLDFRIQMCLFSWKYCIIFYLLSYRFCLFYICFYWLFIFDTSCQCVQRVKFCFFVFPQTYLE